MNKLYEWQKKAREMAKKAEYLMLNVACGLGKTFIAALIAQDKEEPCIIIAPKALCEQWRKELEGIGVDSKDIFVYNQPDYSKNKDGYEKAFNQWLLS